MQEYHKNIHEISQKDEKENMGEVINLIFLGHKFSILFAIKLSAKSFYETYVEKRKVYT